MTSGVAGSPRPGNGSARRYDDAAGIEGEHTRTTDEDLTRARRHSGGREGRACSNGRCSRTTGDGDGAAHARGAVRVAEERVDTWCACVRGCVDCVIEI